VWREWYGVQVLVHVEGKQKVHWVRSKMKGRWESGVGGVCSCTCRKAKRSLDDDLLRAPTGLESFVTEKG